VVKSRKERNGEKNMSLDSRGTIYKQDFESGQGLYGLLDAISKKLPATEAVENDSLLLDVGCACGDIGAAFHKLKNCRCVGFEYNLESIEVARSSGAYDALHQVDLDLLNPDDFSQYFGRFDYILIGDVLEHLRNPDEVIRKLKKFLKPGGAFLLSFPNIAHASIKAALLFDRFDYAEYGLLDKTHIHFFTYKSIASFLSDANLRIEHAHPLFFDIFHMLDFNPYILLPHSARRHILKDVHSHIGEYIILCRSSNGDEVKEDNLEKLNFKMRDYRRNIQIPFRRCFSDKIFKISKCKNGRKHIRLFGIKIFSFCA
jgi:2-polyprenyl-3-methyl-5-hydroxy-6-metoxy-1,4-benzoquinol methylase